MLHAEMYRTRPEAALVNVTSGLAIAPRAGSPVYFCADHICSDDSLRTRVCPQCSSTARTLVLARDMACYVAWLQRLGASSAALKSAVRFHNATWVIDAAGQTHPLLLRNLEK